MSEVPPTDRQTLVSDRALRSLRDEMQIQSLLDRPSWTAVHSHHFFDPKDNVWRELDAVASRSWKTSLNRRPVIVKVVIIVESKHLGQKHILLPPLAPLRQLILFDWLGSVNRSEERLAAFAQTGLDVRMAQQLDFEIAGSAADIMPNAPNLLYPPREGVWNAAGFVEAQNKGKNPEELSASVVWRARLTLQSAAKAIVNDEISQSLGEVQMATRLALLGQVGAQGKPFDVKQSFLQYMAQRPFTLTVFHPVVVVDADLWGVTPDDLVEVKLARIHLTGVSRFPYFWFDLVHRDSVDTVIARAQAEYDRQAAAKALEPFAPNMGIADFDIGRP